MFQLKIIFYLIKSFLKPNFKDKSQLLRYQKSKLTKHLAWVKKHSPFYQNLQHTDFEQLPLMDKAAMMFHFDELNTAAVKKEVAIQVATSAEMSRDFDTQLGGITVGLSSGTSGNKGIFLATENERAQWVAEVLRRVLPIKIGVRQKIAFFLRSNSKLYESVKSKSFDFHFFDLAQPIDTLIAQTAALQADIIIAPPSVLMILAQKVDAKDIEIYPKKIVSVAEVLEKDIKIRLERSFGQIVHQVYQATEGFLGSSCAHGTLHLHEDIIFFEKKYTDNTQKSFYPIISDFSRRTQPIIRYELNDLLHERETPCPCGSVFTAIDHIEGRSDDILQFGAVQIFPDFFRYAVLLASDDILNFQVEQVADNQLIVRLEITKNADKNKIETQVETSIKALLFRNNVTDCRIVFEVLEHIDFYNKFRRIKKVRNEK